MKPILTIIDPHQFTSPLAGNSPHLIGNVGERRLAVKARYFNPSITEVITIPAGPLAISFGSLSTVRPHDELVLPPGMNTQVLLPDVLPMDLPDETFPLEGEFILAVERDGMTASIIVRVDHTDLHLVSPWPEVQTLDELARRELATVEESLAAHRIIAVKANQLIEDLTARRNALAILLASDK